MRKKGFIILLLSIIILINLYSYFYHNKLYPSIDELLKNPSVHNNRLVEYRSGDIVSFNFPENELVYKSGKDSINVMYDDGIRPHKSKFGNTVIFGVFKDGHIQLINLHNNNYNYVKYIISVIGITIFLFYLIKEWEIKGLKLCPRIKKCRT